MSLHFHYDQLTEAEREFVDGCFDDVFRAAKIEGIPLNNADKAERAVDALAKLILESRPAKANEPEPEPLPPLPKWSEPTAEQESASFWKYVGNIAP